MNDIFKGLVTSDSWGHFDKFSRLIPEVLSIYFIQFKFVFDALKTFIEKSY